MMRNLQKDLELCQKATPGPWGWKKHDYYEELVNPYGITVMDDGSACGEYAAWINSNTSDGKFIAEARTGWPEAIQRAMIAEAMNNILREMMRDSNAEWKKQCEQAEARVKELETTLKIMEKQLEIATKEITNVNSEFDNCPSEYDRKLTCTCNGTIADVYRCWLERWKQKALAELKDVEGKDG